MRRDRSGDGMRRLGALASATGSTRRAASASAVLPRAPHDASERAPTAVRGAERGARRAYGRLAVALESRERPRRAAIADLGSGAGLPGPGAGASRCPGASFDLVESQARKCAFIASSHGSPGLANARVVCARVEEWRDGRGEHDLVVARALAPQPVVLEYAAPLLRLGGALVDWRGRRARTRRSAVRRAAERSACAPARCVAVTPFAGARDRHLHVFEKVAATPPGFPRRPGMARKRPLGA